MKALSTAAVRAKSNAGWLTGLVTSPRRVGRFFFTRGTPKLPKLFALLALAYLIWPADLIPDIVPIMGWLDDIGFAAIAGAWLMRAVNQVEDEAAALAEVEDQAALAE